MDGARQVSHRLHQPHHWQLSRQLAPFSGGQAAVALTSGLDQGAVDARP